MSWNYLFVETKINWFTQLCQQQLSIVKDKFQNNFKLETFKSKSIDEIKDRFKAKPFENFPNFLIYFFSQISHPQNLLDNNNLFISIY